MFAYFGALALDVELAGGGVGDADALEVVVLGGGIGADCGGVDAGGAEVADAGVGVGEGVLVLFLGAGGFVLAVGLVGIVEHGRVVGRRAGGALAVGVDYHQADAFVLDVVLGDAELGQGELPLVEGMVLGLDFADEVDEAVVAEQVLGLIAEFLLAPDVFDGGEQAVLAAIEGSVDALAVLGGVACLSLGRGEE